jgi:hypothetical protein
MCLHTCSPDQSCFLIIGTLASHFTNTYRNNLEVFLHSSPDRRQSLVKTKKVYKGRCKPRVPSSNPPSKTPLRKQPTVYHLPARFSTSGLQVLQYNNINSTLPLNEEIWLLQPLFTISSLWIVRIS